MLAILESNLHIYEFYVSDGCDLDTIRQWMDNEISEIVPREKGMLFCNYMFIFGSIHVQ